jgi:hypothetical protein
MPRGSPTHRAFGERPPVLQRPRAAKDGEPIFRSSGRGSALFPLDASLIEYLRSIQSAQTKRALDLIRERPCVATDGKHRRIGRPSTWAVLYCRSAATTNAAFATCLCINQHAATLGDEAYSGFLASFHISPTASPTTRDHLRSQRVHAIAPKTECLRCGRRVPSVSAILRGQSATLATLTLF